MSQHALVVGAGLAGMLTAYYLTEHGYSVTVVDRNSGAAQGASHANGGQLSYVYCTPLASPFLWKELPDIWKRRHDGPIFFDLKQDVSQWVWWGQLLWESLPANSKRRALALQRLNFYSRQMFAEFYGKHPLGFDLMAGGRLEVFRSPAAFDHACDDARQFDHKDAQHRVLTAAQCVEMEPALASQKGQFVGGLFAPMDVAGDAFLFVQALERLMLEQNRSFRVLYNTEITGFQVDKDVLIRAKTSQGPLDADVFVMAAGSLAPALLEPIGVHVPVVPMKGYSLTAPLKDPARAPRISFTDADRRLVFTRLGNRLRVAGFAEFSGVDSSLPEARCRLLKQWTEELLPGVADMEHASFWTGLRPVTPFTTPLLGGTKFMNMYLNVGHGMLGWTQAHGAAKITADIIAHKAPAIDIQDYVSVKRF